MNADLPEREKGPSPVSFGEAERVARFYRRLVLLVGVMNRLGLVLGTSIVIAACGGDSPAGPTASMPVAPARVLAAHIGLPAGAAIFDVPGCQALRALHASVGLSTTTCPQFTGILKNTGD